MSNDSESSEEWEQVPYSDSTLEIKIHHSKVYNVIPYVQSACKKRKIKSQKTRQINKIASIKSKIWVILQLQLFSFIHDQTLHNHFQSIASIISVMPSSIFPCENSHDSELAKLRGIVSWWNLCSYEDKIQYSSFLGKNYDFSLFCIVRACHLVHLLRYIIKNVPVRLVFPVSLSIPESAPNFLPPFIQYWHNLQWNSVNSQPQMYQDIALISLLESGYMINVSIIFGNATVPQWITQVLEDFDTKITLNDNEQLCRIVEIEREYMDHLLITTIPKPNDTKAFKRHPCFVLEKDLKYNQIIHPKEPLIGHVRDTGDPIYLRRCVQNVRSKEAWLFLGRLVKDVEPIKVVIRKQRSKTPDEILLPRPVNLYGLWQTIQFQPISIGPEGEIPKNSFNNIELFHSNMLPLGAVHIRDAPGVGFIARSLKVDYANAVIGFQFHQHKTVPIINGIVIDKKHEVSVRNSYEKHLQDLRERSTKERKQLLETCWKRLVKKALIWKRIETKYNK